MPSHFLLFFLILTTCFFGVQGSLKEVQHPVSSDTTTTLYPLEFNPEKIEDYRNTKAFNYLEKDNSDSWWTRLKKWLQLQYDQLISWLFGDYKASTILSLLLRILPYLIIAGVIGLAIWLFIRFNPGSTFLQDPARSRAYSTEEEQLVRGEDISTLLAAAIRNENYRLAVRFNYLLLLKLLNEKGYIRYQYQKTNSEYLNEIPQEHVKTPFKKVIRLYDFIWYGNFPVGQEEFSSARQSFQKMENLLNPTQDDQKQ